MIAKPTAEILSASEKLTGSGSVLSKGAHIFALSIRILGPEALSLVAFSIPVGFVSGLLEIVFALELQRLLIRFRLLPDSGNSPLPLHIPIIVSPLIDILVVSAMLVLFRFFTLALPPIAGELFLGRVRRQIVNYITFTEYASVDLSSMEASHLLSNMAPRSQSFFASLSQFLTVMVMIAVLFLGMISISLGLAVLTMTAAGLILLPFMRLRRVFNRYSVRSYALIHVITRRMMSDIRNLHLVKLMGADMFEHDHLFEINDEFIGVQRRYFLVTNLVAVVPMLMGVWIVVGVIWINSAWSLIAPSVLVPFIYLLYRLASTISQGLSYGGAMMYAFPFFKSLSDVWEKKLERAHRSIDVQHHEAEPLDEVAVQDLSVGRDEVFFTGLNFYLGAGATLLIRGESGRGKTTLLLTLVGMLPPKSGIIRWNGDDISAINTAQLRRAIGYAGADPFLLDMTIRENLLFGASDRSADEAQLDHALWCAAADFVQTLPRKKETLLREDGDGISAGQKQRIALARALLLKPTVLFLDEAMANIDEATEELIMSRLRETYPDMIIIAVSHRSSMRRWATTTLDL